VISGNKALKAFAKPRPKKAPKKKKKKASK